MKKIIYTLFLLVFSSCNTETNNDFIIKDSEMTNILTDLHLAEAYVSQLKLNTTNTLDSLSYYKQLIYKKHQITESLFNRSMAHYSQDPKKLEKIYKEVKKQIEDLDSQLPHIDETENLILKEKQDTIESVVNKNQPFSNKNKP